jgi:hypothetical protein
VAVPIDSPSRRRQRDSLSSARWVMLMVVLASCKARQLPSSTLLPEGVVACPSIVVAVTAGDGFVQGSTQVSAGPSVPDPRPLTYLWTASGGGFLDASQPSTTYFCPRLGDGPQTISLTASRGPCSVSERIVLICSALPPTDTGEGGAPGGGGRGGGGGRPGTDAGPVDAAAADATTDGADDAAAGDDGGGGGGIAMCGADDATTDEGDACNACTMANCYTIERMQSDVKSSGPPTDGCHHLTSDADRVLCEALYCCIRAHGCLVDGDATQCWCGDVDPVACSNGTLPPTGPCLTEFRAAAKTTEAAQIALRVVDPTVPVGGAVNLAACRFNYCSDRPNPACAPLAP